MTRYAGEIVPITHTATQNGEPLDSSDVSSVEVTIYDAAGNVVLPPTAMDWSGDPSHPLGPHWKYMWNSEGLAAGTYRVRVLIDGINGGRTWTFTRVQLYSDPV